MDTLTNEQLIYAGLDAWVALKIFEVASSINSELAVNTNEFTSGTLVKICLPQIASSARSVAAYGLIREADSQNNIAIEVLNVKIRGYIINHGGLNTSLHSLGKVPFVAVFESGSVFLEKDLDVDSILLAEKGILKININIYFIVFYYNTSHAYCIHEYCYF
jgi:hypothetical protein